MELKLIIVSFFGLILIVTALYLASSVDTLRNKRRECLEDKIYSIEKRFNELELFRKDINAFKWNKDK